jgi:hypothetical protein
MTSTTTASGEKEVGYSWGYSGGWGIIHPSRNLLLAERPLKEPVTGPEAGEKGSLGKAEMLKTETLNAERAIANFNPPGKAANRLDEVKGRMLRETPGSGGSGKFYGKMLGICFWGEGR